MAVPGPVQMQVTADASGLVREVGRADAAVDGLAASAKAARTGLGQMAGGMNQLQASGTGANRVLVDLGRFTNDATQFQYGFRQGLVAVANQIDGLVMGFGAMRQAAQATGTTMRAQLVAGLTGPGGLLLALNVVATVAVVFGDKIAAAFDRGSAAARAAGDDFRDALDELIRFDGLSRQLAVRTVEQSVAIAQGAAETIRGAQAQLARREALRQRQGRAGQFAPGITPAEVSELARLDARFESLTNTVAEYRAILEEANATTRRFNALARGEALLGGLGQTLEDRRPPRTPRTPRTPTPRTTAVAGLDSPETLTSVERIREALAATRREIEGMQAAGRLTVFERLEENASALERAFAAALQLDPSESGRAALIADLNRELKAGSVRLEDYVPRVRALGVELRGGELSAEAARKAIIQIGGADTLKATRAARTEVGLLRRALIDASREGADRLADSLAGLGADLPFDLLAALTGGGAARRGVRLAEIDAEGERDRLAEAFREGTIGAEEYRLRLEEVAARLREIRGTAPTVGNAFREMGRSAVSALRDVVREIERAILKMLILKGIEAGLNLISPGLGTFVTGGGSLFSPKTGAAAPNVGPALSPLAVSPGGAFVPRQAGMPRANDARGVIEIPYEVVRRANAGASTFQSRLGGGA